MRMKLFMSLVLVGLASVSARAAQEYLAQPMVEAWGFSSEEYGTGAYLGVDISDVTSERMNALKLKEERGVEVLLVDQDSPAGKAGIKEHDVILTLNGSAIESGAQLRRMIRETPPGRSISLGLSRDGQPMTIKVQLADRRQSLAIAKPGKAFPAIKIPPMPLMPDIDMPVSVMVVHSSMRSGLMVENLTPQLGEFFGVKGGEGVLIRSVEKGSRAASAGLRAGDVITKINGERVSDAGDFSRALRSRKESSVTLSIVRDKKEQTVTLTMPERRQTGTLDEEESWSLPDIDADVQVDLSDLNVELADLQPQISFAVQEAGRALDEARKSLCDQKELVKKQAVQMRRQTQELRKQQRMMKQQLRRRQRDMEREMRLEVLRDLDDMI
jgi:membrane-associated protease RseP (regulator of RpoE activity)